MEYCWQPEWAMVSTYLYVSFVSLVEAFSLEESIDIFKLLNAKLVHFCHPSGSVHSTAHVGCSVECSVEWTDPGG